MIKWEVDVEDLQTQREALRRLYKIGVGIAIPEDKSLYHKAVLKPQRYREEDCRVKNRYQGKINQ